MQGDVLPCILYKNKYFSGMTGLSKQKKKGYLGLAVRFLVAAAACGLLVKSLDFKQLADTFQKLNLWILAAAVGIFTAGQTIVALRWWILMRANQIFIRLWQAVKLTFLGIFFNNFLPGAISGDFLRAWYVAKHTDRKMLAAISVFMDRLMALFASFIMACTALLIAHPEGIFQAQDKQGLDGLKSALYYIPVILIGIIIIMRIVLFFPFGKRLFLKLTQSVIVHFRRFVYDLSEAALSCVRKPLTLPISVLLTLILQFSVIFALWMVGSSLGMTVGLGDYLVYFPLMWVVGSIPVSIAGVGVVEGGIVALFSQFSGASVESAAALALCQRLIWILGSLPGMAIHLKGGYLPEGENEFFIDGSAAKH